MSNSRKQGISLIVLVITIIVIIVLAGAVILSLEDNNPISSATEATFNSNKESYGSELALTMSNKYIKDFTFDSNTFYASKWNGNALNIEGTVKEYIPSLTASEASKYMIYKGKLMYVGTNINEKQWLKEKVNTYPYISDGLMLWLRGIDFQNTTLTNLWTDSSGNNNHGFAYNFSNTVNSGNGGQGALTFDGVNDYVEVNNLFNIGYNDSITISVWVNASQIANNTVIIGKNQYEYLLYQRNATFGFIHWNDIGNNSISISTDNCITVGQWINVTYKYDGITKRGSLYVNGLYKTSAISTFNTLKQTTETLKIGTGYLWGGYNFQKFNGKFANVLIYNRALTDSEILDNYNAGK